MAEKAKKDWWDEKGNLKPGAGVKIRKWIAVPDPHTKWDLIRIPRTFTVEELSSWFEKTYGLVLKSVAYGKGQIWSASNFTGNKDLLLKTAPLDIKGGHMRAKIALSKLFKGGQPVHPDCNAGDTWDNYCKEWKRLTPVQQKKEQALKSMLLLEYIRSQGGLGAETDTSHFIEIACDLETMDGKAARTPKTYITRGSNLAGAGGGKSS